LTVPGEADKFLANAAERKGDHRVKVEDFSVVPPRPRTGAPLKCILRIRTDERAKEGITADFSISFVTEYGAKILQLYSGHVEKGISIEPGTSEVVAEIDAFPLTPGRYRINLWVGSGNWLYDWIPEAYTLDTESGSIAQGVYVDNRGYPVVIQSRWSTTPD
jgi:hypothetical protein